MLNLIMTEFVKFRRRRFIWLMLLAAFLMPFAAVFYFGPESREIEAMAFYKFAAFSYTSWIVLPIVLGLLCTMLMYDEYQNNMFKQLWIIPVNKMSFFISKFIVVFAYSLCFMALTAFISVLTGIAAGIISFTADSFYFLLIKCLEIGVLTPFAMIPVLTVAASQKGYILPVCFAIVYTFTGFIFLMVNMYLHPLSDTAAVLLRNIDGVILNKPVNIRLAFLSIGLWDSVFALSAKAALNKDSR